MFYIFLYLVEVTSHHSVIATDVSTGFGAGCACVLTVLQKKLLSSHVALTWETAVTKACWKTCKKDVLM